MAQWLKKKKSVSNAGDSGDKSLIPWSGGYPWGGNGHPFQYSAQKIPWTEEPGVLQSKGLQRVPHSSATEHSTAQLNNKESSNTMKECAERS